MRERRGFDFGSIAGSIAFAFVFILWWQAQVPKNTNADMDILLTEDQVVDFAMEASNSLAEERKIIGEPEAKTSAGRLKPWASAASLGNSGVEQAMRAYKRHEEEGDPFKLRSELKKARGKVEGSIEALNRFLALNDLSVNEKQIIKRRRDQLESQYRKLFPIK